jgi:hypothetical protein
MTLTSNQCLAQQLIELGHYEAGVQAIMDVNKSQNGFLVIDAPSGAGKTLFGVALRMLSRQEKEGSPKMKVLHCIWEKALGSQLIYGEINIEQEENHLQPGMLFSKIRSFKARPDLKHEEYEDYVWNHLLAFLFNRLHRVGEKFSAVQFKASYGLLDTTVVLYIDEVPASLDDVNLIINIREACKSLPNLVVVLAGTNAKASNMNKMSNDSASTNDNQRPNCAWALIMTRLPCFCMEHSPYKIKWDKIREWAEDDSDVKAIVNSIDTSIRNGGNPRIIVFALEALFSRVFNDSEEINIEKNELIFMGWQRHFSSLIIMNKFSFCGLSKQYPSIVGQANLMLQASSVTETADTLIGEHFAMRAIPSVKVACGKLSLEDCSGWLYLGEDKDRCIGHLVFYIRGALRTGKAVDGSFEWQKTVFASVDMDPLLYIGSCRICGFLSSIVPKGASGTVNGEPIAVYHLMRSFWRWGSAGQLNFQNQDAIINTGSCLEVAVALSICNAASRCQSQQSSVVQFLEKFMEELGIIDFPIAELGVVKLLMQSVVPRMMFPCDKVPAYLARYAGCVRRVPNKDKYDVVMTGLNAFRIRFEAKDRKKFSTTKLLFAGEKLFVDEADFLGVLVVRQCCDYWKKGGSENSNIARLITYFAGSNIKKIKHIVFVSNDSACRRLELPVQVDSDRCLLVIQTNVTRF